MVRLKSLASWIHRFFVDAAGLLLGGAFVVWSVVPDEFGARMIQLTPFMLILTVVYMLVALALGVNKSVWRYTNLEDLGVVAIAIGISLVLTLGLGFIFNRLDGVFRSLPLLQGTISVFYSWMLRALFVMYRRLRNKRKRLVRQQRTGNFGSREQILIVGVNELTNLYISVVAECAGNVAEIVGLLSQEDRHKGRLIQQRKVLGRPDEVLTILAELRVHGVYASRIVVAMPFEALTLDSREALLEVERRGDAELVLLKELIGLQKHSGRNAPEVPGNTDGEVAASALEEPTNPELQQSRQTESVDPWHSPRTQYVVVKRFVDFLGAFALSVFLMPVVAVVALLVLINDGIPILFWQKRPGRKNEPMRIYKFRTMRRAHIADGSRIADVDRVTWLGRFLRRSRLDELPQLYHVIVGEMSFVGPRPLLDVDQHETDRTRLSVLPGITGYAQVCGCNRLSVEEKMILDNWYVENMSLRLDLFIIYKTVGVLFYGEHRDEAAIAQVKAAKAKSIAANAQIVLRKNTRNEQDHCGETAMAGCECVSTKTGASLAANEDAPSDPNEYAGSHVEATPPLPEVSSGPVHHFAVRTVRAVAAR